MDDAATVGLGPAPIDDAASRGHGEARIDDADAMELAARARAKSAGVLRTLEQALADVIRPGAGLSPQAAETGRRALQRAATAMAGVAEALAGGGPGGMATPPNPAACWTESENPNPVIQDER